MNENVFNSVELRHLQCELGHAMAELREKSLYVEELRRKIRQFRKDGLETEIRNRLLEGQTYRQIQTALGISAKTIAKISVDLFGYRNLFWQRCTVCCKKTAALSNHGHLKHQQQ